jgi:cytochrome c556
MPSINSSLGVCLALLVAMPTIVAADSNSQSGVSVKEVMESVITPATNTLWGAEDPQTDEEWQLLEDAAITTITAGKRVALGGTGANDAEWASKPEWQAFNDVMIKAAADALQAIRERNIDALFVANDILYPPCEGCHIAFNPGVQ